MVPSRGKASYLTIGETYSADKAPAHTRAREPESPRTRLELLAPVACDELVEATDFSILGFILVQERQVGLFEFSEKIFPADFFETFFPRAEIDAENSRMPIFFGFLHRRRHPVAVLGPFLDFLMIGGGMAFEAGQENISSQIYRA